uniref:Glutamyl-tRNA(Gln) amidotransferase subunit B, mitochondrial n=1 Tax=Rhabditophanes sp. KR3021 TaxID=114890 RepID=A0AC35TKZ7_9BILA
MIKYRVNIGLEIHAQLASRSKLFSSAPIIEDAPPNTCVDLFDCATPGTLPLLNKECVHMALKAAKLLNCHIPQYSRFDRKHYFYPDMPMGYQITQQLKPIAKDGFFTFYDQLSNSKKEYFTSSVPIKQLQLEQDSGKTLQSPGKCMIDLNRAGVGLIEIVTEPTLTSSTSAVTFLEQLRLFLIHNNITKGEMHKGHLRVDANISLIPSDASPHLMGERSEVKNINSFKDIGNAIDFEIARHEGILRAGGVVRYETRTVLGDGRTVSLRDKEGETVDYRFTAEPNLPLLQIESAWLDKIDKEIKLNDLAHIVYIEKYGLRPGDSLQLTANAHSKKFMDIALPIKETSPDHFLSWYNELRLACGKVKNKKFPPEDRKEIEEWVRIVNLEGTHKITKLTAIDIIKKVLEEECNAVSTSVPSSFADDYIQKKSLWRISDKVRISEYVSKNCKSHPELLEKAKTTTKAFNKLRNFILTDSNKTIALEDIEKALKLYLETPN